MAIAVDEVNALTVKGIEAKGGLLDSVFEDHAYLKRLRKKEGTYSGSKKTFPFNYKNSDETTGKFYKGAETLEKTPYESNTELAFELIELVESLTITHRDLALNQGKEGIIDLASRKLMISKEAIQERFTKGIYSDGTALTGAMTTKQFPGMRTFLKNDSVNYGGLTNTDISSHVAYVNDNSGNPRALTTALIQNAKGGASVGSKVPNIGIMRQATMDDFVELILPYQRTMSKDSLDGLGHGGETLRFSGVEFFVDELSIANSISFINENFVRLYSHPQYNMKRVEKKDLEDTDAMMQRIFWKGVYACSVLRYNALLTDLTN